MPPKKKAKVEVASAVAPIPPLQWQWNDCATWKDFIDKDANILETAFQAGKLAFSTTEMSFSVSSSTTFDMTNWTQTNDSTNVVRPIRRLTNNVSWEYLDDHDMFVAFYDDDNAVIELAWRTTPHGGSFVTTALSWNKGYDSKYTFQFSMDHTVSPPLVLGLQTNQDSGKVRKLRRVLTAKAVWDTKGYGIAAASAALPELPATATSPPTSTAATATPAGSSAAVAMSIVGADVFAYPSTWQPQTLPFERFPVAEGSAEYKSLIDPFRDTLKMKAVIHSVERLQNETLWKFYALTRHKVACRNKGNPKEMLLYHGARVRENMNAIMEFGFDMRVARDGSAGIGIYFAVNASYSNGGYVLQNKDGSKEMFVCRVTVGSCVKGHHGLKRPPAKSASDPENLHDSVHNGVSVMYIVFDNFQAYPEYLIKYTPSWK